MLESTQKSGPEKNIFARTELLIGTAGMEKLSSSTVAVFGLGGVGSYAAEALARAGIGSLVIVDFDLVDVTNINRQLHALQDTVGQPKTKLMEQRLLAINPNIIVTAYQERFTLEQSDRMLGAKAIDFVLDAIDDVNNKTALIIECVKRGLPAISAMGAGNKLDPTSFKVDSIWKTSVCPLARVMRRKLKDSGLDVDVPVVYSTAKPMQLSNEMGERPVPGSISFVPPVAGLIMAGYVVDKLLGLGNFSAR